MDKVKPGRKKVYSCDLCGNKFTKLEKLNVHLIIHSKEACEQSVKIDETFGEKNGLMKNSLQKTQACSFTSIANNIQKESSTHSQIQSSGIEEREISDGKYNLNINKTEKRVFEEGDEAFSKETKNMPDHREERQNYCKKCGKRFERNSTLKEDLLHTGEECNRRCSLIPNLKKPHLVNKKERSHICEYCGKEFDFKSLLIRHVRTHTKEKPYTCKTCNRAFTEKSHLKRHQLVHTQERPHICQVCGKAFSEKGNLTTHLRIHTKEKPYNCETCNKNFTRKGALKNHLFFHTTEKPHFCEVCGKAFKYRNNLKRHLRAHTK